MITRGMSVRVHNASGQSTDVVGVVTRCWTNEATGEAQAEVSAYGRRWSGDRALLRRIDAIAVDVIPPGVRR